MWGHNHLQRIVNISCPFIRLRPRNTRKKCINWPWQFQQIGLWWRWANVADRRWRYRGVRTIRESFCWERRQCPSASSSSWRPQAWYLVATDHTPPTDATSCQRPGLTRSIKHSPNSISSALHPDLSMAAYYILKYPVKTVSLLLWYSQYIHTIGTLRVTTE